MIIDLSIPRLFIKDKLNEVVFNARMKGYKLSRYQIAAAFTAAMILGCNGHALAYEGAADMDENIRGNIYSVVFAIIETLKSYTLEDIKGMGIYCSSFLTAKK